MRINVTQIKVEVTMYYFNNIYIEIGERNQRREMLREWKKERERMRGRVFLSFSRDALTWGVRSLL